MPPPSGYAYTNILTATPKNTVVKAWADYDQGQLLFYDPQCTDTSINHPQIAWNAIHRQWPDPVGTQHFDWQTNILDLGGGTIKTLQGCQQNPGTGDTTWDGSCNPPRPNADLGIYSFQVTHTHKSGAHPNCFVVGECGPQSDKPGALTIEDVSVGDVELSFGDAGEFVRLELSYRLTRLASVCRVTLYAVDAEKRANDQSQNPFENLGTKALPRGAGTHVQTLTWNTDPCPYYWYWVVVEARENQSVARLYNRDRQPKWAVPKGVALTFTPPAHNSVGDGLGSGSGDISEIAQEHQSETDSCGTHYTASRANGPGATEYVRDGLQKAAVVYVYAHANNQSFSLDDAGTPMEYQIYGEGVDDDPDNHLYCIERIPGTRPLEHLLFGFYMGCHTAEPDSLIPPFHRPLIDATIAAGADVAAGFQDFIYTNGAETYATTFWDKASTEGWSIGAAAISAMATVYDEHDEYLGYDSFYATTYSLELRPARFGKD